MSFRNFWSRSVFGSLGSNYSWRFAVHALGQFVFADAQSTAQLRSEITQIFGGDVVLTYKGRDAIECIIRGYGFGKGDVILSQAFTCHAIEEAITRSGASVGFVDLEKDSLHPSVRTLDVAFKKNPAAKAVLVQHTLGFPAPIVQIRDWATQHQLVLIEDLAQAYGALTESNEMLGTFGDAVVLSFGRDKIIDGVSGGAAVFLRRPFVQPLLKTPIISVYWPDLLYPLVMMLTRSSFDWQLGKIIIWLSKKSGLVRSPVATPTKHMTGLPAALAALALEQLQTVSFVHKHRQAVSEVYLGAFRQALNTGRLSQSSLRIPLDESQLSNASLIRFPILVDKPDQLARSLKKYRVHISDRWYRKAVDSGSLGFTTTYTAGTCPEAERVAQRVLNLPTHRSVSLESAKQISAILIQELESRIHAN